MGSSMGVLDENRYGSSGHASLAKDAGAFRGISGQHGSSAIATKMEDVEGRKFVGEALAKAVGKGTFDPSATGNEADYAMVANAVGGPTEGTDVAVVEGVLQFRIGVLGIGVADSSVERWVRAVGGVVVLGFLATGPGWIADDDADIKILLAHLAGGIAGKDGLEEILTFVKFECVGEADSVEGAIFTAGCVLEGGFDVRGCDVVGQQDDFVGVNLRWMAVAAKFVEDLLLG